jgi:hypothetical protein
LVFLIAISIEDFYDVKWKKNVLEQHPDTKENVFFFWLFCYSDGEKSSTQKKNKKEWCINTCETEDKKEKTRNFIIYFFFKKNQVCLFLVSIIDKPLHTHTQITCDLKVITVVWEKLDHKFYLNPILMFKKNIESEKLKKSIFFL